MRARMYARMHAVVCDLFLVVVVICLLFVVCCCLLFVEHPVDMFVFFSNGLQKQGTLKGAVSVHPFKRVPFQTVSYTHLTLPTIYSV